MTTNPTIECEPGVRRLTLNDLPQWGPWPARLLGLASWNPPSRTVEKIDAEYDKDKWANLLEYSRTKGTRLSPQQLKEFAFASAVPETVAVALGEDIFEMGAVEAFRREQELIVESLRPLMPCCKCVVELGCGFGANLALLQERHPDKHYFGGEYSPNAVELAAHWFRQKSGIRVERFNFYEESSYSFLNSLEPPIVVFTNQAIEQLPSAASVVRNLAKYRDRICGVVHLEPGYELQGETLLGLMRRRYAQVNDYNRDLVSQVRGLEARIVRQEVNVLGINPFNPVSLLQWEFA